MRPSLTLLQRAVIHRLREAGYQSLADAAHSSWPRSERCPLGNLVAEREPELRADFERADRQAVEAAQA